MSQQDDLALIIRAAQFDPREFDWTTEVDYDGWISDRLVHTPSGAHFTFDEDRGARLSRFVPGREVVEETAGANTWPDQRRHVALWLEYVRREIQTPNVWARLSEEAKSLAGEPHQESPKTPFEPHELEEIRGQLSVIRHLLLDQAGLDQAQRNTIEERLSYLEAAASQVGRIHWRDIFVGRWFNSSPKPFSHRTSCSTR